MEDDKNSPPPQKKLSDDGSSSTSERIDDLVRRGHLVYDGVESARLEDQEIKKTLATQIDQQISHYKIIQQIGAGGMGLVYLARDTKLDRPVAIKMLPAFIAANQ